MDEKRVCRVRLDGGPKHGWAYDAPMHWEVAPDGSLIWLPPNAIGTPVGRYVPAWPDGVSPERAAAVIARGAEPLYLWEPQL